MGHLGLGLGSRRREGALRIQTLRTRLSINYLARCCQGLNSHIKVSYSKLARSLLNRAHMRTRSGLEWDDLHSVDWPTPNVLGHPKCQFNLCLDSNY
jgi:hypothetical protein